MTEGTDLSLDRTTLRVRLGLNDTHYREYLIPAATILRLFADCSTELGLRENDGHYNLLAAYESATFLLPCRVGDYIEIQAEVISRGNRSKRVKLTAHRHVAAPERDGEPSKICNPPELVATAVLVSVKPKTAASA